ncbi:MAG: hypothetical protein HGA65_18205 [Oscillochloris sp.]|nr:hypothetical protein [Oscillochloris sp.]
MKNLPLATQTLMILALLLTLGACQNESSASQSSGNTTASATQPIATATPVSVVSDEQAIEILAKRVEQDGLYKDWNSLQCLSFMVEAADEEGYDLAINENHGGECPGDPSVAPVVDRFRVKSDGTILWLDSSGTYVDYEQAKRERGQ